EALPKDVYVGEAGFAEPLKLGLQGDHVAHVIRVASLFLVDAVGAVEGRVWLVAVVDALPDGFQRRVRRADRVIVDVPAARPESLQDLAKDGPLAVVWQVVNAERRDDRVQLRRNRLRPGRGEHVELDVTVPAVEG